MSFFIISRTVTRARVENSAPSKFITARDGKFWLNGRPFKFVGANVAVTEREAMSEMFRVAAQNGVKVVRIWSPGENIQGNPEQTQDVEASPHSNTPNHASDDWDEGAFAHLDWILAEAARNNLHVQLCLTNWWRETGGVTYYLRRVGITDATDDAEPYGINVERAMLFYTNEAARRMYRQHVEKILTRRNSVTGVLYHDDSTIFAYELMNEAQAPSGRWAERREWVAEMSAFAKSLDSNHLVTPGTWGYRSAVERRAWLEEHQLSTIDFCDVHLYPRDDLDSYIDSPKALREFVDNRVAAAYSIKKPLVFGEFGMLPDGYKGVSETDWFRAYFDNAAERGASGAMFWILTPDPQRRYSVTYTTSRDENILRVISDGAKVFDANADKSPTVELKDAARHPVPRQFAFERKADDAIARPGIKNLADGSLLYTFAPEAAMRARFEKMDGGTNYIWGDGIGSFEYQIPARESWRRVGEIIVRAHLQPVLPFDARGRITQSRVTLFLNGANYGSRIITLDTPAQKSTNTPPQISIQEWRINSLALRLTAARGNALTLRFSVTPNADLPFGVNISGFPEGYDAKDRTPIEIEMR